MQWRNPPRTLDAAYERDAMLKGFKITPSFPENIPIKEWEREPDPIKNSLPSIADLVIQDIQSRKEMGLQKYGTPLQPFNGRRALKDLYEELMDAVLYLRQEMYEQDHKN
jgi:hypothetical protein